MGLKKFPLPESKEYSYLEGLVRDGFFDEAVKFLIEGYGFANRNSAITSISRRFGKISERPIEPKDVPVETPIIQLPPVKLREYRPKKVRRGDEETATLQCGDGHADKITKSYNKEIYRDRMGTMFESTMTIVNLHRNMYPINKLRIINLGDNAQGESPYQGSKIGTVSMGARDQIAKLAAPMWNDIIGSFKQHFSEVIFDGFGGNHGFERLAPETSRYDFLLYDILQAGIGQQKGITINIHEPFADIVWIEGFRFLCFHGDGIPCAYGIPFFALTKKIKSWHMQYKGFNYVLIAHFHKRYWDEIGAGVEVSMSSTLVSDDEWALKKMGISSTPSQTIFGVHPRHGVTWRYPVVVDFKFLPEKQGG